MSGVRGKSGRKAKPKSVKELAGTFRADQHNESAPTPQVLERPPRCPSHIKGEARKTWQRVARILVSMGVLTEADLHALEAYCVVYARWQDAEAHLVDFGVMLSRDGQLFPSPYLRIAEDGLKQMRAWMNEFGITPSSRSRVKVEKKETGVEDEDWFHERRN